MKKNGLTKIFGYSNADWSGDPNDRRSTIGYRTFIGENLVTWKMKSKKQSVYARSSVEIEYLL